MTDLDQRIYPASGYEKEEGYQEIIEEKINEIHDFHKKHIHYEIINKQIDPDYNYWDLYFTLLDIYLNRKNTFKLNLGFGFILHHTITNTYKSH